MQGSMVPFAAALSFDGNAANARTLDRVVVGEDNVYWLREFVELIELVPVQGHGL
jgi:hypothetical protein